MFVRVLLLLVSLLLCASQGAFAQDTSFSPSPVVKIAVNPVTNKVYVVNEFDNSVTAYDESAGTSVRIPVGSRPQFIAADPVKNRIYVNNAADSTLSVIDGATDTNLTPTALVLGSQGPITVNAATNIVYVMRMSTPARDEVTFYNASINDWYTIATESFEPTAVAVNPVTNTIFVAHYATGDVRVISGAYNPNDDFPATTSIGAWSHPFAIAVNPVTNKAYVLTQDSRGPIGIIDGNTLTGNFPLPAAGHAQNPQAVAVNPVTNKIYAAFQDEVIVIDGATNAYTYIPIGPTGTGPTSIAVNTATNKVYVATNNGSFVTIDGATNATTTQPIPSGAVSLGINPVTGTAYVFGDTLTRVSIDTAASSSVPLTTAISPLPSNTSDPNPSFTLNASSAFAPTAPAVAGVYYQLDSTSGPWSVATGSGNGPYTAAFTDLEPGTHTLYAFAGDLQLPPLSTGSQSTALIGQIASYTFTVTGTPRATPTVNLLSSANPATQGQSITFTASVTGSSTVPTGTVAFHDGGVAIAGCGAIALASGTAACTTTSLAGGTHSISAAYSGDSAYRPVTSSSISQVVKGTPTVVLTSSANPSPTGQSITLTVAVSGSIGTPTGTVSITENGTAITGCGALTLASGSATCSTSTLSAGSHTLIANYAGDGTYASGTSAPLSQVVKVATTTTLTSSANPSSSGQPLTLMVNVAGSGGTPTGTVSVTEGGTALAGCSALTLNNGGASCTTSSLASGTHNLAASYTGDATFAASASATLVQTINSTKVNATLSLSSSANPSLAGQSVTFTFAASGSAGTATGTVTFNDNGSAIAGCSALTLASGGAQCSASLPAGTHAVNAAYSGDANYNAGTSPTVNQVVNVPKVNPAVTLSSSSNPSTSGQAVTFTISVSGSNGIATGSVTVNDGANAIAACSGLALQGGSAHCSTANLAVGTHSLVATYSGDNAYNAGTSATLSQAVNPVPTVSVTLASSANPAPAGAAVTFTATLAGNSGSVTGFVDFLDGAATIPGCNGVAVTSSAASCTTTALGSGDHSIVARYAGDGTYPAAQSAALAQTIQAPSAAAGISLSTTQVDFGGQSMNTTSPAHQVVVTNVGSAPLSVTSLTTTDAQFAASADCTSVAPGQTCTITLTFTPAVVAGTPLNGTSPAQATISIGSNAASGPNTIQVSGAAEKSLVSHYYRSILRRDPDAGGQQFWQSEAARVTQLGADVNEAWYALAMAFFASPEYLAFKRDDAGFVTDLYRTFFNREPDSGGFSFWLQQLQGGMPRDTALANFMFSAEFANFTRTIFGNTSVRPEINLAMDFYRGAFARLPDTNGLTLYVSQLRAAQCQGASAVTSLASNLAQMFFGSTEYANRQRDNGGYVSDLYNTFMRRGADLGGATQWISALNNGSTNRTALVSQFVGSAEFASRVQAVVAAGCVH